MGLLCVRFINREVCCEWELWTKHDPCKKKNLILFLCNWRLVTSSLSLCFSHFVHFSSENSYSRNNNKKNYVAKGFKMNVNVHLSIHFVRAWMCDGISYVSSSFSSFSEFLRNFPLSFILHTLLHYIFNIFSSCVTIKVRKSEGRPTTTFWDFKRERKECFMYSTYVILSSLITKASWDEIYIFLSFSLLSSFSWKI